MLQKTIDFFEHTEKCPHCRPFDLCPIGQLLMNAATEEVNVNMANTEKEYETISVGVRN